MEAIPKAGGCPCRLGSTSVSNLEPYKCEQGLFSSRTSHRDVYRLRTAEHNTAFQMSFLSVAADVCQLAVHLHHYAGPFPTKEESSAISRDDGGKTVTVSPLITSVALRAAA